MTIKKSKSKCSAVPEELTRVHKLSWEGVDFLLEHWTFPSTVKYVKETLGNNTFASLTLFSYGRRKDSCQQTRSYDCLVSCFETSTTSEDNRAWLRIAISIGRYTRHAHSDMIGSAAIPGK